jgi:hypothetical protein
MVVYWLDNLMLGYRSALPVRAVRLFVKILGWIFLLACAVGEAARRKTQEIFRTECSLRGHKLKELPGLVPQGDRLSESQVLPEAGYQLIRAGRDMGATREDFIEATREQPKYRRS